MRQIFNYTSGEMVKTGVTFGSALAMAISFNINQSVFWALIHGLLSWFYVIWYILIY
ncbi:MAG: hypothetical protein ACKVLE_01535 [Fidelibacterota bacterium]